MVSISLGGDVIIAIIRDADWGFRCVYTADEDLPIPVHLALPHHVIALYLRQTVFIPIVRELVHG
jgi:hypothetical protein